MLFKKNLILIKLGGSVITDKNTPNFAKKAVINRLCREIAQAYKKVSKDTVLIVANGGGSFSHPLAAKYGLDKGVNEENLVGLALTSSAEVKINRIIVDSLLKEGLPVMSFSPLSFLVTKKGEVKSFYLDSIVEAIRKGIVPVTYGDMVIDETLGCFAFSSEKLLGLLALKFKNRFRSVKIISCGITDGVYDNLGKTIPQITKKNFSDYKKFISGSRGIDITGGMLHKVEEFLALSVKSGVESVIINGQRKNCLFDAICGKFTYGTTVK